MAERTTLVFEWHQVELPDNSPIGDLLRTLAELVEELEARQDGDIIGIKVAADTVSPRRFGQVTFRRASS